MSWDSFRQFKATRTDSLIIIRNIVSTKIYSYGLKIIFFISNLIIISIIRKGLQSILEISSFSKVFFKDHLIFSFSLIGVFNCVKSVYKILLILKILVIGYFSNFCKLTTKYKFVLIVLVTLITFTLSLSSNCSL